MYFCCITIMCRFRSCREELPTPREGTLNKPIYYFDNVLVSQQILYYERSHYFTIIYFYFRLFDQNIYIQPIFAAFVLTAGNRKRRARLAVPRELTLWLAGAEQTFAVRSTWRAIRLNKPSNRFISYLFFLLLVCRLVTKSMSDIEKDFREQVSGEKKLS